MIVTPLKLNAEKAQCTTEGIESTTYRLVTLHYIRHMSGNRQSLRRSDERAMYRLDMVVTPNKVFVEYAPLHKR